MLGQRGLPRWFTRVGDLALGRPGTSRVPLTGFCCELNSGVDGSTDRRGRFLPGWRSGEQRALGFAGWSTVQRSQGVTIASLSSVRQDLTSKNQRLTDDLSQSRQDVSRLQSQVSSLSSSLYDAEQAKTKAEEGYEKVSAENTSLQSRTSLQSDELPDLRKRVETLKADYDKVNEEPKKSYSNSPGLKPHTAPWCLAGGSPMSPSFART